MILDVNVRLRKPVREVAKNICAVHLDLSHSVQCFIEHEQIPMLSRIGPREGIVGAENDSSVLLGHSRLVNRNGRHISLVLSPWENVSSDLGHEVTA